MNIFERKKEVAIQHLKLCNSQRECIDAKTCANASTDTCTYYKNAHIIQTYS
jgi:hypothetical protein